MQILYHENPVPYITINNFYSDIEINLIWQELNFLTYEFKLESPEKTGSAKKINPNKGDNEPEFITKKNHGIFLDGLYNRREISNILNVSRKLFNPDLTNHISLYHTIFNYLKFSSKDATLLSYYENSDQYFPHADHSVLTAVTWLYKEPRKFNGGDFSFSDFMHCIPVQNNMLILFPSFIKHSVSEIKMDPSSEPFSGNGRYAITNFITPF